MIVIRLSRIFKIDQIIELRCQGVVFMKIGLYILPHPYVNLHEVKHRYKIRFYFQIERFHNGEFWQKIFDKYVVIPFLNANYMKDNPSSYGLGITNQLIEKCNLDTANSKRNSKYRREL